MAAGYSEGTPPFEVSKCYPGNLNYLWNGSLHRCMVSKKIEKKTDMIVSKFINVSGERSLYVHGVVKL